MYYCAFITQNTCRGSLIHCNVNQCHCLFIGIHWNCLSKIAISVGHYYYDFYQSPSHYANMEIQNTFFQYMLFANTWEGYVFLLVFFYLHLSFLYRLHWPSATESMFKSTLTWHCDDDLRAFKLLQFLVYSVSLPSMD